MEYFTSATPQYNLAKDILMATSKGEFSRLKELMDNCTLSINVALESGEINLASESDEISLALKSDGRTPLHIAAKKGYIEILQWICVEGRNRDMNVKLKTSGFTPLHDVIFSLDPKDPRSMLQPPAVGDIVETPPQPSPVGAIIEPPSQPSPVGAVVEPPPQPLGAIIEPPSQPSPVGAVVEPPPQPSSVQVSVELVPSLVVANVETTQAGAGTPKIVSVLEIVEELLSHGDTDANAVAGKNEMLMTPLHIAASRGHSEIVKLLLEWCSPVGNNENRKIWVNAEDTTGSTALHMAAAGGHHDVIVELLNYYKRQTPPLDMAPTNKRRATPLHLAAFFGWPKLVETLLKFDAPVNKTTFAGQTPLHCAVFSSCPKTVLTMLQKSEGLMVSEADCNGLSPLEYAKERCQTTRNDMMLEGRKQSIQPGSAKTIVQHLEGYDVDKLLTERQAYLNSANAILVAAALIASITFTSWLQPPLGFGKLDEDYVAFNKSVVKAFWVFNSISFFFAIATVLAGAEAALPKRYLSLRDIVVKVRDAVFLASWLLLAAVVGVIGAFTCAGLADIPVSKYKVIFALSVVGAVSCLVFPALFLMSLLGWDVSFRSQNDRFRKKIN